MVYGVDTRPPHSRRAFLGFAAAAMSAAVAACSRLTRSAGAPAATAAPSRRRPVSENSLAGDPHWDIRHLGTRNAMIGYAGQASVLPGQPITLYASTTAPSFTVSAFRMGWYGGDLARLVWKSGTVPGTSSRSRP